MAIDDYEDRSYIEGGTSLKNIPCEEVISEPTNAGILQNDLQWGQKALLDFFSSLGFYFNQT